MGCEQSYNQTVNMALGHGSNVEAPKQNYRNVDMPDYRGGRTELALPTCELVGHLRSHLQLSLIRMSIMPSHAVCPGKIVI